MDNRHRHGIPELLISRAVRLDDRTAVTGNDQSPIILEALQPFAFHRHQTADSHCRLAIQTASGLTVIAIGHYWRRNNISDPKNRLFTVKNRDRQAAPGAIFAPVESIRFQGVRDGLRHANGRRRPSVRMAFCVPRRPKRRGTIDHRIAAIILAGKTYRLRIAVRIEGTGPVPILNHVLLSRVERYGWRMRPGIVVGRSDLGCIEGDRLQDCREAVSFRHRLAFVKHCVQGLRYVPAIPPLRDGNHRILPARAIRAGYSPATARKARSNWGGSAFPRFAARRRIPAHAFALKKYRSGIGPEISTCDNEDAFASLGQAEILGVEESPRDCSLWSRHKTSVSPFLP